MLPATRDWLIFGFVMNLIMLTWIPATVGALLVYGVSWWRTRQRGKGA